MDLGPEITKVHMVGSPDAEGSWGNVAVYAIVSHSKRAGQNSGAVDLQMFFDVRGFN